MGRRGKREGCGGEGGGEVGGLIVFWAERQTAGLLCIS